MGLDVTAYEAFALEFTLVAVDGQEFPPTDGYMTVGAIIGPTASGASWAYKPEPLGTAAGWPRQIVSATTIGTDIVEEIGFTAYSPPGEGWDPNGMVVTLRVSAAPNAIPIPEPSTLLSLLVSSALVVCRRPNDI